MKKIDSQALESLKNALGLSGPGSPTTELTDGVVDQVIDVGPIIRRSRTQAQTTGLYTAAIRNIHAGASAEANTLNPYDAGVRGVAPYPTPMTRGFDVWLLNAVVIQVSGSGTLSAALRVNCPASIMGLSTTGAGLATAQNLAFWDAVIVEATTFGIQAANPKPMQKIGMRLPRSPDTQLIFATTSSAIATFDCFMTVGVFPVALGQDVVV